MKRLVGTRRWGNKTIKQMICRHEDCTIDEKHCPFMNEDDCRCLQKILKRLHGYEETGVTPRQLREIDRLYAEKCRELAQAYAEIDEFKKQKKEGIELHVTYDMYVGEEICRFWVDGTSREVEIEPCVIGQIVLDKEGDIMLRRNNDSYGEDLCKRKDLNTDRLATDGHFYYSTEEKAEEALGRMQRRRKTGGR